MWHCSCQGCVGSLYDADGEPVGPALPNSVAKHGPRGRQTDSGTKRAEIHQGPGLYLTPDKQAGYMTATEFQLASAIQPLHAGGVHICLAERGEFELPVRICEQSDDSIRLALRHRDELQKRYRPAA